jgi:hypothetical protein
MRGLPRPDLRLAFLRPEQVSEQLRHLEQTEADENMDAVHEDEDGMDADGLLDEFGEREVPLEEHDDSAGELSVFDSDDSQLSEYQERRQLRREEKKHRRRQERLGTIRRSLRLERQAFRKSIPRQVSRGTRGGGGEDENRAAPGRPHQDIDDMMRRYDERLAYIEEEQRRHAHAASQMYERRFFSAQHARRRRQAREKERRIQEARARAEARRLRRQAREASGEVDFVDWSDSSTD